MSDTLEALHCAAIANPSDRTVRLVYADALDETGDPVHVARAEFIRRQIELEAVAHDIHRLGVLTDRASELFETNWLAWWVPVAKAAKLPDPHVPRKRVRDRVARAVRRPRRPANWPYSHTTAEPAVHLAEYGLEFKFVGGFPEEVRFRNFDAPEGGPVLVHHWGDAMPLTRLSFAPDISAAQWERVDGPHLARLADLSFEALQPEVAQAVAESLHLAALTHLAVNPHGSDRDAIRAMVALPPWAGLRTLKFTGRMSPDGVRDLAHGCTLKHLEELDVTLGNPGFLPSPLGEIVSGVLQVFARMVEIPGTQGPRWADYGPALEALAATAWVRRLRVLRIVSGHHGGLFGLIGERLYGGSEATAQVIPDAAVLALAAAVTTDKLERLVLPAAVVGPSVREDLTSRLGGRVAFA